MKEVEVRTLRVERCKAAIIYRLPIGAVAQEYGNPLGVACVYGFVKGIQ
jgi:hypothetical protein